MPVAAIIAWVPPFGPCIYFGSGMAQATEVSGKGYHNLAREGETTMLHCTDPSVLPLNEAQTYPCVLSAA